MFHTFVLLCLGFGQITKLDFKFETLVDGTFLTVRKYSGDLLLVWHAYWFNISILCIFLACVCCVLFSIFESGNWVQRRMTGSILKYRWCSCPLISCQSPSICCLKMGFGATDRTFMLTLLNCFVVCVLAYEAKSCSFRVWIINAYKCYLCFP